MAAVAPGHMGAPGPESAFPQGGAGLPSGGGGTGPTGLGQRPGGYHAADLQGNFHGYPEAEYTDSSSRIDYGELEHDPSERPPGGPAAIAVRASDARVIRQKWWIPVVGFLLASLLQSTGLYMSTRQYVTWMDHVETRLGLQPGDSEPLDSSTADEPSPLRQREVKELKKRLDQMSPRDHFASWLAPPPAHSGSHSFAFVTFVVSLGFPTIWLLFCICDGNLRLWIRTLLTASLLVITKGVFAWATPVPAVAGWSSCQAHLDHQLREHLQDTAEEGMGVVSSLQACVWIVRIWLQGLVTGMRKQDDLVCTSSLSAPICLGALFALAVFDAVRSHQKVRKLKPMFRMAVHITVSVLLSIFVIWDACACVADRREYSMDVTLALVFSLLVYTSPIAAVSVDHFLLRGAPENLASKDGCDVGDVLVPPCCLPFCLFQGRYFLYLESASEVEEALSAQRAAKQVAEDFRLEQEETALRLLELEAQLESVKQRTQVRERQEAAESQRWLNEQLQEMQKAHELRVEKGLAHALARQKAEMEAAALWQEKAKHIAQQEAQLEEQRRRQEREVDEARREVIEAEELVRKNLEEDAKELEELEALRKLAAEVAKPEEAVAGSGDTVGAGAATAVAAEVPVPMTLKTETASRASSGDFRSAPPEFWLQLHARFGALRGVAASLESPKKGNVKEFNKLSPQEPSKDEGAPLSPMQEVVGRVDAFLQAAAVTSTPEPRKVPMANGIPQPTRRSRPWFLLPSVGPQIHQFE